MLLLPAFLPAILCAPAPNLEIAALEEKQKTLKLCSLGPLPQGFVSPAPMLWAVKNETKMNSVVCEEAAARCQVWY